MISAVASTVGATCRTSRTTVVRSSRPSQTLLCTPLAARAHTLKGARSVVVFAKDGKLSEEELMQKIAEMGQQPKSWDVTADLISVNKATPIEDLADEDLMKCRQALDRGLEVYKAGDWTRALKLFQMALELPGTGLKRFSNKPPVPSEGERMAIMYNIACCHSALGDIGRGLVALNECLALGYDDFRNLRSDPDLQGMRKDAAFESLLKKYEPTGWVGALSKLFTNTK